MWILNKLTTKENIGKYFKLIKENNLFILNVPFVNKKRNYPIFL